MKTIYRSTLVQGVCCFLLIGGLLAPAAEAVKFRTEAGQLQQSKFVIAIPESWKMPNPNIVYIFFDDLGYGDISYLNHQAPAAMIIPTTRQMMPPANSTTWKPATENAKTSTRNTPKSYRN